MRKVTTTATSADQHDSESNGWQTIRRVVPYLWPEGETWVKRRVVIALVDAGDRQDHRRLHTISVQGRR